MVELAVLQRRVQVQHAVATSIASGAGGVPPPASVCVDRAVQRIGEHFAARVQPAQRIADQRELFGQAGQAVQLAAGDRRPHFLRAGDALARLRDPGRVEAAQAQHLVVDRRGRVESGRPGAPRARRGIARGSAPVRALRAEEQEVLRQPARHLAAAGDGHAQLRQQARADALGVDVGLQQRRPPAPRRTRRPASTGPTGAPSDDAPSAAHSSLMWRIAVRLLLRISASTSFSIAPAHGRVGCVRGRAGVGRQRLPGPFVAPQVGRVHAVGAGQFEQRHGTAGTAPATAVRLAGELAAQVVEHAEGRGLDRLDRLRRDQLGPRDQALDRSFRWRAARAPARADRSSPAHRHPGAPAHARRAARPGRRRRRPSRCVPRRPSGSAAATCARSRANGATRRAPRPAR